MCPLDTLGVLAHLETRDGYTTTVGGLAWCVPADARGVRGRLGSLARCLKDVDGSLGAAHVGSLGDVADTSLDEGVCLLLGDLVLGSRGESDVGLGKESPWALALVPLEAAVVLEGREGLAAELDVGNGGNVGSVEALVTLGDERSSRVGEGENGTAELEDLEGGELGDVSGTRDEDALALPVGVVEVTEHLSDVVNETVTGGLWADEGSSPVVTLAGEDTGKLVLVALVGTKHETNLTTTGTNVTGWDIGVGTDVARELEHECVTEATDLRVGLALGVKVRTTLTTTHGEASEGVLEDLLESEELENREVDGWVETETTLVWAESRVELDTVATVDGYGSVIALPGDTELDDTLGDLDNLESLAVLGVDGKEWLDGGGDLVDGLEVSAVRRRARSARLPRPSR